MAYSISNLQADVSASLHGTTLNQITNFFGLCNRAASDVLFRIDPQETKRIVETPQVFNGVWDYPCPVDLKGNRIIDIFPQFTRYPGDVWLQQYNQAFDLSKNTNPISWQPTFTPVYNTGVRSIRINSPNLLQGVVIDYVDTISGNGTWSAGGGATNLQQDNINFLVGGGSLSFDLLAGHASGYLVNSTLSGVNLSAFINQATQFLYTYFPTASSITSVNFQFGSDASDYYSVTTSVTQENTVFQNAWNLLSFPWLGATVVGSPNPDSITYCKVTWNYDGTLQTGMHLNGIQSILGKILQMEYYSVYMFRDAITGAFQERVTSSTNLINLAQETYMIYFNRVMQLACQQQQGLDAMFADGPFFEKEYEAGIARYQALYKSEAQKPMQTYYYQPNGTYGRFMGRGYWG